MKVVSRRTGLSPHVIRAWERRYSAINPSRSNSNRRLYSESEVARLVLLQEATQAGHSISQIARLNEGELRSLIHNHDHVQTVPFSGSFQVKQPAQDYVGLALAAIRNLEASALSVLLGRAVAELGQLGLLQQMLVPLVERIGADWQNGQLAAAHEHLATAVIRSFLGSLARAAHLSANAPRLVATTPPGQWHELGALMAAVAANNLGWNADYLGPCLPAEEIAGAVRQQQAVAVALSLVHPDNDPQVAAEIIRLRGLLPNGIGILVGGRAAPAYREVIRRIQAVELGDLPALQSTLDELRLKYGLTTPP